MSEYQQKNYHMDVKNLKVIKFRSAWFMAWR